MSKMVQVFLFLFFLFPAHAQNMNRIESADDKYDFAPLYKNIFSPSGAVVSEEALKKFKVGNNDLYHVPVKELSPIFDIKVGNVAQVVNLVLGKIDSFKIKEKVFIVHYGVSVYELPNIGIILNDDLDSAINVSKDRPRRSQPEGFVYLGDERKFKDFKISPVPVSDAKAGDAIFNTEHFKIDKPKLIKKASLNGYEVTVLDRKNDKGVFDGNSLKILFKGKSGDSSGAITETTLYDDSKKNLVAYEFEKGILTFQFYREEALNLIFCSQNSLESVEIFGNLEQSVSALEE